MVFMYLHDQLICIFNVDRYTSCIDPMGYGMDLVEFFNPKFVKCH